MRFPQIQLKQTYAKIGLRIIQPVQEIEQPPAKMSIKQKPARMIIDREPAILEIDQEQAWNELNLKSPSVLSRDFAEYGKQQALAAIAEIAQKGDRMAAIENKADAIVEMATEKNLKEPPDFNIAFIPSYGSVKIHFTPADLEFHWQEGGAEVKVIPQKPIHRYTPGKTEVYMLKWPELHIDVYV
jgi:hypothetical protein